MVLKFRHFHSCKSKKEMFERVSHKSVQTSNMQTTFTYLEIISVKDSNKSETAMAYFNSVGRLGRICKCYIIDTCAMESMSELN